MLTRTVSQSILRFLVLRFKNNCEIIFLLLAGCNLWDVPLLSINQSLSMTGPYVLKSRIPKKIWRAGSGEDFPPISKYFHQSVKMFNHFQNNISYTVNLWLFQEETNGPLVSMHIFTFVSKTKGKKRGCTRLPILKWHAVPENGRKYP